MNNIDTFRNISKNNIVDIDSANNVLDALHELKDLKQPDLDDLLFEYTRNGFDNANLKYAFENHLLHCDYCIDKIKRYNYIFEIIDEFSSKGSAFIKASDLLKKSRDLQIEGDLNGSIQCIEEAYKLDPDEPYTLSALSSAYRKDHQDDKAEELDSKLNSIISGYSIDDWNSKFIDKLEEARIFRPNNPDILADLGVSYQLHSNLDKAEEFLEEAYKLEPQDNVIMYYLGEVYFLKGNFEKAIKLLEKAANKYSKVVYKYRLSDCYYYLGHAYLKLGMFSKAVENLTKSINLYSDQKDKYYLLGKAYLGTNNPKKAIKFLDKAIEADGEDASALKELGNCYLMLDKIDEAEKLLKLAAKRLPNDSDIISKLLLIKSRRDQANNKYVSQAKKKHLKSAEK